MNEFEIYTDGACSGNPGPGGWAVVVINRSTGDEEEFSGGEKNTTNNRMELTAAIEGLKKISPGDGAEIFTDSSYLKNAFTAGWLTKWKRNGWRTATKNPVLNQDLWVKLDKLVGERKIKFNWVKGHAGNFYNERCDKLARDEVQKFSGAEISSGNILGSSNPKLKLAKKLSAKNFRRGRVATLRRGGRNFGNRIRILHRRIFEKRTRRKFNCPARQKNSLVRNFPDGFFANGRYRNAAGNCSCRATKNFCAGRSCRKKSFNRA